MLWLIMTLQMVFFFGRVVDVTFGQLRLLYGKKAEHFRFRIRNGRVCYSGGTCSGVCAYILVEM